MRDFVIITDSGSCMGKTLRNEYDIKYVVLSFSCNGTTYPADLDWEKISAHEFYDLMREGNRILTSQALVKDYVDVFEKYILEGKDILYLGCSSKLSASVKNSFIAKDELLNKYPDSKIICIDTLRGSYALALLCIAASYFRKEGKSLEEVANWINDNKFTSNMEGTVETLKYLKMSGRVSATSAFFGGLLNIKPIIIGDALGQNYAIEKVKGRRVSLERIAERMKEQYLDVPHQKVIIAHADCYDEAVEFKNIICKTLGKELDITIDYVGPCTGSATGPGMLCVYYFGKEVLVNKEN